jgi:hypothetical protein
VNLLKCCVRGHRGNVVNDKPGGEGGGGAKRSAEQLEIENTGLRREVDYLRQQRDILKKTLGILSEPLSSALNGLRP